MITGRYELVIVWQSGDPKKEVFEYDDESVARAVGEEAKKAHGEQIEWWGVRPQFTK